MNYEKKVLAVYVFMIKCIREMISCHRISSFLFIEALGTTWTKHYCWYKKENKELHILPYNQVTGKLVCSEYM